jgi:hypothetical protein
LTSITSSEEGVIVGSAVTLTDMESYLKGVIEKEAKWKTRVFGEVIFETFFKTKFIEISCLKSYY